MNKLNFFGQAIVLGASLAGVFGCGSDPAPSNKLNCNLTAGKVCIETGNSEAENAFLSTVCTAQSGTVAAGACSRTNSVGSCSTVTGSITTVQQYYSDGFTAATAQTACESGTGTFAPAIQ